MLYQKIYNQNGREYNLQKKVNSQTKHPTRSGATNKQTKVNNYRKY